MNNRRFSLAIVFCFLGIISICSTALADGMIIIEPPIVPHPPVPWPHYVFAPLEVRQHHVAAKIKDQIATTEVDQTFYNPNNQRLEGTYIFPIPKNAQIDKFSMDINGKMMDAELLDAGKARQIYEDIVRRMKDPALLEYAGQGMFKLRIFPIEPNSEKRIKLKYSQLLASDNDMIGYLYPLNTEKFSAQPLRSVSVKVELESAKPLKSVYSPSHNVEVKRDGANKAVIGYEAANVKPDTDFQLFYSPDTGGEVGINVLSFNDSADKEGGFFLLLASPAAELTGAQIIKKDVAFVFDTSGSMAERGKLEQAKKALDFCLRSLNQGDRFEIIRFSTEAELLFGRLTEASESNVTKGEQFVSSLKALGGTAIADALNRAVELGADSPDQGRPYLIVFLTDGMPTIGPTNEDEVVRAVMQKKGSRQIRIFSFGVGNDVNTHLLDKLTEQTQAASQYVLPDEDIEIKVSNFYSKVNAPVLSNPRVSYSDNIKVSKIHPAPLPDVFKGEQLMVLGRYTGSGSTAITLSGDVNGEKRSFVYEASFVSGSEEYGFIPRLWATRRVGYLLDQIRLNGESKELRDEAAELARKYGIVTPYTAYLIVEDEAQRSVTAAERTLDIPNSAGRLAAKQMYMDMQNVVKGEEAVGGAQAAQELAYAPSLEGMTRANKYAFRGGKWSSEQGSLELKKEVDSRKTRYVDGRAFYFNGKQWIDAQVQTHKDAKRVTVKFNSDDYFNLLQKYPKAAAYYALGRNVVFVFEDVVYEVTD
jgi:Ca-activated chloride channel homolog